MLVLQPRMDLRRLCGPGSNGSSALTLHPVRPAQTLPRLSGSRSSLQGSHRQRHGIMLSSIRNLPIFPLDLVAFPGSEVPLTIFEARYRVLFSTLLAGGHDIDEDLVQTESEFKASKEFGMTWATAPGTVANTGTILEIKKHHLVKDGRLIVHTIGSRRFRILKVLQNAPVLTARVEIIDDADAESPEAAAGMQRTLKTFLDVWRLAARMRPEEFEKVELKEEDLDVMAPAQFSYHVATLFGGTASYQQLILQEDSTVARLQHLDNALEKHGKYLQALVALKGLDSPSSDVEAKAEDSASQATDNATEQNGKADDDN